MPRKLLYYLSWGMVPVIHSDFYNSSFYCEVENVNYILYDEPEDLKYIDEYPTHNKFKYTFEYNYPVIYKMIYGEKEEEEEDLFKNNLEKIKNKIMKVYSHRRSGTNFLCGLLYVNYYKGIDMKSEEETTISGRYFVSSEGLKVRYNEWGDLFGSHSSHPPKNLDLSTSLYIRRDPVDTAYSLYARSKKRRKEEQLVDKTFSEYVNRKQDGGLTIIESIEKHHKNWEKTGVYIIDYEDLCENPIKVLEKIEEKFGLVRMNPEIQMVGKVGWTPGRGVPNEGRRVLHENR